MSNVIPFNTKLDHRQEEFDSAGDMGMIATLLRQGARYQIPDHIREKVITTAGNIIENANSSVSETVAASRLILEADKINVALVKLAVPQKHEHFNAQQATTEELVKVLKKAQALMPALPGEIIDATS